LPNAGRAGDGPSIVWVRVGNTSRRDLLTWFRFRLPAIVDALDRGEALIEIV
jgi:predicted nuclease of predicted toxin-antitoxin system